MAINVSVQHNGGLLPGINPFKCHEEVLYLQPMIIPLIKRFDIFPPDWGMLRGSRCVQIFFNKIYFVPTIPAASFLGCVKYTSSVYSFFVSFMFLFCFLGGGVSFSFF